MRVLVFVVLILAITNCTSTSPQCSTLNPFLTDMVNKNQVKVTTTPVPIANHCNGEWQSHGGCCDVGSLMTYAARDKSVIMASTEAVYTVFQELKAFMILNEHLISSRLIHSLSKVPDEVLYMLKKNTVVNQGQDQYRKCWSGELVKLRRNSLCFTCSGRSGTNFFSQNKALITPSTCSEALSACMLPIVDIVNLAEAVNQMWTRDSAIFASLSLGDEYARKKTELDQVMDAMKAQEVLKLLQVYRSTRSQSTSPEALGAEAKLCQQFINLKSEPFIVHLKQVLLTTASATFTLNLMEYHTYERHSFADMTTKYKQYMAIVSTGNTVMATQWLNIYTASKSNHEAMKAKVLAETNKFALKLTEIKNKLSVNDFDNWTKSYSLVPRSLFDFVAQPDIFAGDVEVQSNLLASTFSRTSVSQHFNALQPMDLTSTPFP